MAPLVPELYVTNIDASLAWYVGVCGFHVVYARPEERFAYLARGQAEIMLEEPTPGGRTFGSADRARPFGRGVNLQIEVADARALYDACVDARSEIVLPLERKEYRRDEAALVCVQFVTADPDGYLLRFQQDAVSPIK